METLRIGFDAKRLFHNKEGLGMYARTLIRDLVTYYPEHKYILFTPSISQLLDPEISNHPSVEIVTKPVGKSAWWWRSRGIKTDLISLRIDVYVGLSNELPFQLSSVPCVVVIHDLIFKKFPQQFSLLDRWIYNLKFKNALAVARKVVCISQSTRNDIVKQYGIGTAKTAVIYQPVSPLFRSEDIHPISRGAYHLFVGTVNPRKNLNLIIEAYKALPDQYRKRVIVAGRGGRYKEKMELKLKRYDLSEFFEFRAYVSTGQLIELYKNADSLIFPSYYEGFGRPIIEALTFRKPVIAMNISSIPEVLGKHGIIIEYDSVKSLTAAIIALTNKAVRSSVLEGVGEHLRAFDPATLCHEFMTILQDVK